MDNEKRHKIAEGNTAEIFEISQNKVLKLFKIGYSKSAVQHEYNNHRMVNSIMNNTPELFKFHEENQRFGFIMEKVRGKSLATQMSNMDTFRQAMKTFTDLHKNWLMKTTDAATPYTEWMLRLLNKKSNDKNLIDKIKALPAGNVLCHGDFHPYNVLCPETDSVIIDFANVCQAPKEYDIARTYFLLKKSVIDKPVAERYLENMQLSYHDIQIYIEVLQLLRQYENPASPSLPL